MGIHTASWRRRRLLLIGSLVLGSASAGPAGATAAYTSGCRPAIYNLGLPTGAVGGQVRAHAGDLFGGTVAYPDDTERPVLWLRTNPGSFRVVYLGQRGIPFGVINDINRHGEAVGFVVPGTFRAFAVERGVRHPLQELPGAAGAAATGVNDDGTIVGFAVALHGLTRAVSWRSWRARPLLLPTSQRFVGSSAWGLNNLGVAVGNADTRDLKDYVGQAWRPSERVATLPAFGPGGDSAPWAINDKSMAAGQASDGPGTRTRAAVWRPSTRVMDLGVLSGDATSVAHGLSEDGRVVGQSVSADGSTSRILYWPGRGHVKTMLPYGGDYRGDSTIGRDIESNGEVVGVTLHHGRQIPTLWTCADRQAFIPPAKPDTPEAEVAP